MHPFVKINLILFLILSINLMQGCCNRGNVTESESEMTLAIDKFISNWHQSSAASNHAEYIGAMAEDGVYIGTDATEYWETGEFSTWSKPYFDKGKGWNLQCLKRNIYLGNDGQTAWFDELLDTGMGLCRGSGILQKTGGQWKICHYVLSSTIPNELTKDVMQLKGRQDSLLMQKIRSAADTVK